MSDLELLFAVLAALYVWECAWWVPRGCVVLRSWIAPRFRVVLGGALLGNQRGGFVFAPPLPPLGTMWLAGEFPLSISETGMLGYARSALSPGWGARQTGRFAGFADARDISHRGKLVLVNSTPLLKASSPSLAAWLVRELKALAKAPAQDRRKAIERLAARLFDAVEIRARWQECRERTRALRLVSNCLVVYVFVVAPALIWLAGLKLVWIWLAAGLLALTTTASVLFRKAHRALYPAAEDERFTQSIFVLLSPANAMRAVDMISRPLLEAYHPLAAASVFCAPARFRKFATRLMREMRYPTELPVLSQNEMAARTEKAWRDLLLAEAVRLLADQQIQVDDLLQAPKQEPGSASYCPRCEAQFRSDSGVCVDCDGIPLKAFAAAPDREGPLGAQSNGSAADRGV